MSFRAPTVYITGHLVAGGSSSPELRDRFLDDLQALEPNQHGFIEVGRIAELSDCPALSRLTALCLNNLGEMSRVPLPGEVKTIETINIEPPFAERFRSSVINGDETASLLPSDTAAKLDWFSQGVSDYGALHISGFDVDGVGQLTALALAEVVGEPYVEVSEADAVVQTIQPHFDEADLQTSGSFGVDLDLHVENVGQEDVPDFIVLVCETNEEQAETVLVSPLKALWAMRERGLYKEEALLWRNNFWVRTPTSFGRQIYQGSHTVVEGYAELPMVHADFADVGSDDTATREAYKLFQEACTQESQAIILQSGDALLLRNTGPSLIAPTALQVMHGRKQFTPNPSRPRMLHRVYAHERK